MLPLLGGTDLGLLSRELKVTPSTLSGWRTTFPRRYRWVEDLSIRWPVGGGLEPEGDGRDLTMDPENSQGAEWKPPDSLPPRERSGSQPFIVFTPNTSGPYGYEIAKILALPDNFHFSFRFRQEWLSKGVKERIKEVNNKKQIPFGDEDVHGYVLLKVNSRFIVIGDDDESPSSPPLLSPGRAEEDDSYVFYPIRTFRLSPVDQMGSIFKFDCILGSVIALPNTREKRQSAIDGWQRRWDCDAHRDNDAQSAKSSLVFLCEDCPRDSSNTRPQTGRQSVNPDSRLDDPDSLRPWINVVHCFHNVTYFNDVVFLKLRTPEVASPVGSWWSRLWNRKAGEISVDRDGRWILEPAVQYIFRIGLLYPRSSNEQTLYVTPIKIKGDGISVNTTVSDRSAIGRYDAPWFLFSVDAAETHRIGALTVRYDLPTGVAEKPIDRKIPILTAVRGEGYFAHVAQLIVVTPLFLIARLVRWERMDWLSSGIPVAWVDTLSALIMHGITVFAAVKVFKLQRIYANRQRSREAL